MVNPEKLEMAVVSLAQSERTSQGSTAIFYSPDGYQTSGSKLMGRHAAGAGFLRAFARTELSERITGVAQNSQYFKSFEQDIRGYGFAGKVESVHLSDQRRIGQQDILYLPGPGLNDFAWRRQAVAPYAYSLCGVTHTTASHRAMESIAQLITAPLFEWDALICTSRAVLDSVRVLLEAQADYLRWKLAANRFTLPQLPVIPLGVHCEDFVYSKAQREQARAQIGASESDIVVIFLGRLSFHAKAHPQAMYLAMNELARKNPGRGLHLVQCGWFANEAIESAFKQAAAELCPHVQHHFLDGRQADAREVAWAGADIYVSFSDNIQETFGISPVEAMAAGLPVVVSDWDGYRDTVRDGIDGFRIPTLMPQTPDGVDLASRYDAGVDSYDMYCGHTCELVAVDVSAAIKALEVLVASPELRTKMGSAGRARAKDVFDWTVVMSQYRALWRELADRRALLTAAPLLGDSASQRIRPDRMDPFQLFASYPTAMLGDGDSLVAVHEDLGLSHAFLLQCKAMAINSFAQFVYPESDECLRMLELVVSRPGVTVTEVVAAFPRERALVIRRGLVWMIKMHVLRFPG